MRGMKRGVRRGIRDRHDGNAGVEGMRKKRDIERRVRRDRRERYREGVVGVRGNVTMKNG